MSALNYRSDIQGLRAIAVLAVMAFHFQADWLPGGFVGVDIFLVISGFLITGILLKKKENKEPLFSTIKTFYLSRFKRIAPAYFFMLVLVAIVAAVFFIPSDFKTFRQSLAQAAWFNSNHYFADFGDYFAPANFELPLLHTWSLAVEIQFYLLAPFLILFLPKRYLQWVLLVLFLGLTALAEYRLRIIGAEQATYFSLFARLPAFFGGALTYLIVSSQQFNDNHSFKNLVLSLAGLSLIVTAFLWPKATGYFPGLSALVPVIGAGLIMSAAHPFLYRMLSHSWLVWIGALSYSLYLWHWPILAFLRYYTGEETLNLTLGMFFLASTFLLAIISYYCVETPLRKQNNRKRVIGYACLFSAVAVVGGGGIKKLNAAFTPDPLPVEYMRYADPDSICHGKIVGDCLRGDLASDREILVLGDSHAAMLNHFFDDIGKELNIKFRVITASSCVTIPGFDVDRLAEWAREPCISQIEQVEKYLENVNELIIAAMWSYQLASDDFTQALNAFFRVQPKQTKNIYPLTQVPLLNNNPQRLARFRLLGINAPFKLDKTSELSNKKLKSISNTYTDVHFIDLDTSFSQNLTKQIIGEIYFDESHLNEIGVNFYKQISKQQISSVFVNGKDKR